MRTYSFDGCGLNDNADIYKRRIATFTNKELAMEHGCLMAAAPALLDALDNILKTTPANRLEHDVYVSARLAILAARGTL
jgi:hypothetical protein